MENIDNIALFIATQKGYVSTKGLLSSKYKKFIKCVFTFKEKDVKKDWSKDINELCINNDINCYFWDKEIVKNLTSIIKKQKISYAVAISFRYIIDLNINKHLKRGLIVFHDSLLPQYRGFAPTPTAIICGENKIGVSAIFANEEVDTGDIIIQEEQHITDSQYIDEIIYEQSKIYANMLVKLFCLIENDELSIRKQDNSLATYSIWRSPEDCLIDWNKDSKQIFNFIRALSDPYPGAYTFIGNKKCIIHKASILDDLDFKIRDCGKIWKIEDGVPIVICGKGMIRIEYAVDENDNKIIFNKVRERFKNEQTK